MAKKQKNYKNKKEQILVFHSFSVKQFISLILGALIGLTGLALIVTHLVGDNLAGVDKFAAYYQDYRFALNQFNTVTHTTLGFLGWGIIALLLGAVIVAIALSLSTRTEERAKENQARKEARRKALVTNDTAAIEADVVENK